MTATTKANKAFLDNRGFNGFSFLIDAIFSLQKLQTN
jgi:hypothetical protein